jgi:hypothetical protein
MTLYMLVDKYHAPSLLSVRDEADSSSEMLIRIYQETQWNSTETLFYVILVIRVSTTAYYRPLFWVSPHRHILTSSHHLSLRLQFELFLSGFRQKFSCVPHPSHGYCT